MRTAVICCAAALALVPHLAMAAAGAAAAGLRNTEAPRGVPQSRYDMAPGSGTDPFVGTEPGQRKFTPGSRGAREADGARFGDGEVQYFEGPSWDYRTSRRGPMFEVGALGGGMENAPYLAHVAMNWRF